MFCDESFREFCEEVSRVFWTAFGGVCARVLWRPFGLFSFSAFDHCFRDFALDDVRSTFSLPFDQLLVGVSCGVLLFGVPGIFCLSRHQIWGFSSTAEHSSAIFFFKLIFQSSEHATKMLKFLSYAWSRMVLRFARLNEYRLCVLCGAGARIVSQWQWFLAIPNTTIVKSCPNLPSRGSQGMRLTASQRYLTRIKFRSDSVLWWEFQRNLWRGFEGFLNGFRRSLSLCFMKIFWIVFHLESQNY